MKKMDENAKLDLPMTEQLEQELRKRKYRFGYIKLLRSTISSLVVVAAIAVLISMLFLPVLRVVGTSMTPTLQNQELVVCRRIGDFETGDIIAFYFNNKVLLKRVIGVSGDVIDIDENGTVYVNGEAIDEPYVDEKALGECDIELPYQVPEDRIFVMGDHRSTSVDSRSSSIGCVAEELVIGKVIWCIWPLDQLTVF
ncbi:MAG: signal peptidase I [Ruminococcus sp.]|nr:signal peptidase I [Ruminococcus sp.]